MPFQTQRRRVWPAVPAVAALLLAAGCGDDDAGSASAPATPSPATTSAATTTDAASGDDLNVGADEYAFAPATLTAPAGEVRITLDNTGKIEHELVVLKTDQAADALASAGGGRVSESGSVGEVSETAPGAKRSATLTLKPGRYVYVCNIPGHYMSGMRGTLTVR